MTLPIFDKHNQCECGITVKHCHPTADMKDVEIIEDDNETPKEQWIKEFDEIFVTALGGVLAYNDTQNNYEVSIGVKYFISSLLTQAVQEERKRIKDYLENAKGQYSTEEMRDGYWIIEDIISLLNKE